MVAISFLALIRARKRELLKGWCGRMKAFSNRHKKSKRRQKRNNKQKIREKRMMMNRRHHVDIVNVTDNPRLIISSSSSSLLDDDLVVSEILSRLPVKSLMRFKLVCKRWESLIHHDRHFRDLHFTRSKTRLSLFMVTPIDEGHREFFLSANLFEGRADVYSVRKTESMPYDDHIVLKPIHGLICFLHCFHIDRIRFYNPSTREVTPWIKTTTRDGKNHDKYPTYEFGFDPATKQHKVICTWTIFETETMPSYAACEILTVGDNSWRRIDEVPPYHLDGVSLYVSGSIYWTNKAFHKYEEYSDDGAPEVLVAFDVGSEKFRAIAIPDFIIDQPRESRELDNYWGPSIDLLEVDGRVALLCRRNRDTVSLWIFDDAHDCTIKEKIRTTNSTSFSDRNNWTDVTITLPFSWVGDLCPNFYTVAGTNQIILQSYSDWVLSVYSFNWKKKTFEKVEISGISEKLWSDPSLFTPLVESLFLLHH